MNASQVSELFNDCFSRSYDVGLFGGAVEPLYEPGRSGELSRIWFREDYVSSALHEVAHWLIAGPERRRYQDYGYWYEGQRDVDAQRRFEAAEARPQALEWILSESAGIDFRVSCDNFNEATLSLDNFRRAVRKEVWAWLHRGLTRRAAAFQQELVRCSGKKSALACETYEVLPK